MWSVESIDELLSLDWVARSQIDELLSIFWVPSSTLNRGLEIERAITKLEARSERSATYAELAAELNVTLHDLLGSLRTIGRSKSVARVELRNVSDLDGEVVSPRNTRQGGGGLDPTALVDQGELRTRIAVAIVGLPEWDQLVLALHYFVHLTLPEIGHVVGMANDAVPIRYAKAVLRLRSKLPELRELTDRPTRGSTPRELAAFRRSCGADEFCHALVGDPPYRFTLCGQLCQKPVTNSHQSKECPTGLPLCPTCEAYGDWGRH